MDDIAGTLRDRGWLIWGDCVYPCLSRPHDAFVEAERRFYPAQMHRMLQEAGFEIVFSSHFLGWGFPVALGLAVWHRMALAMGWSQRDEVREAVDDRPLPAPLNRILAHLTFWEWRLGLWGLKSPFGVSRLLLARKCCPRAVQRSPGSALPIPIRGALSSLGECVSLPTGRCT